MYVYLLYGYYYSSKPLLESIYSSLSKAEAAGEKLGYRYYIKKEKVEK